MLHLLPNKVCAISRRWQMEPLAGFPEDVGGVEGGDNVQGSSGGVIVHWQERITLHYRLFPVKADGLGNENGESRELTSVRCFLFWWIFSFHFYGGVWRRGAQQIIPSLPISLSLLFTTDLGLLGNDVAVSRGDWRRVPLAAVLLSHCQKRAKMRQMRCFDDSANGLTN